MTGIVVGLGGNAAHTNRALSLKGLIMQGCPYVHYYTYITALYV